MLPASPEGLRHWRVADAPVLAAAWADAEVLRWNAVPADASLPLARRWIAGTDDRWTRRLALDLVIVGDDGDTAIGEVGLANLTTGPARAEVGIWLLAGARRQGRATAALAAMADLALGELGFSDLWARVDEANDAGQRLFARAGWSRLGTAEGTGVWGRSAVVLR